MRLLYTSTICIWDNSILVMLCFYGDPMRILNFIKNTLQFLPIALPLELGAFQVVLEQRGLVDWETSVA
jgi:hypothetical protein